MTDTDLSQEIHAFLKQKPELLKRYGRGWVLFVGDECKGSFDTFEAAAEVALEKYRTQRFLIRHTDEAPPQIPMFLVDA